MKDRRLHICFVAPTAFPLLAGDEGSVEIGGAQLQQVIVGKELVRRGYRVSMICLDFGQPDPVCIDGITVFRAFHPDKGLPILRFFWPRLTSIWNCMRRTDADVYYQRAGGMLTGVVAAFCRLHRRRSIFAAAGEPMIRFRRDRWIYEFGLRKVDRILVQNDAQAQHFRRHVGRESTLVPNCLPMSESPSARTGQRILWVSTIRSLKRPRLLLELARVLPQFQFTMVGGPGEREAQLYDLVKTEAASLSNVEFKGFVPFTRVGECFDAAALLVNTSETEGFPNTFLQAWGRSIPTVSFVDVGAILDGKPLGSVVGSLEEMSRAVARLMDDDLARAREGARCREYFWRNHAPDTVLDRYEEVLDELGHG